MEIIITAGAASTRIDGAMRITGPDPGAYPSILAAHLSDRLGDRVGTIYYIRTPDTPRLTQSKDATAYRKAEIVDIVTPTAESMLRNIKNLVSDPDKSVRAVIHLAGVPSYACGGIADVRGLSQHVWHEVQAEKIESRNDISDIISSPAAFKAPGSELRPNQDSLLMRLQPVENMLARIRACDRDLAIIGIEETGGVERDALVSVAAKICTDTGADYIIAADARTGCALVSPAGSVVDGDSKFSPVFMNEIAGVLKTSNASPAPSKNRKKKKRS